MKGELTTLLIIVSSAIFSVHDVHGQRPFLAKVAVARILFCVNNNSG